MLNLRLVLAQIVALGPISRVEIARNTNLTKQTITNMVESLLSQNLVVEMGVKKAGGAGKPSTILCFNEKAAYSIAIRVIDNELTVGLFHLNGECVNSLHTQIEAVQVIEKTAYLVNTLLTIDNLAIEQVLGIGLSVQNSSELAMEAHQHAINVQHQLAQQLNLPIVLESTSSACASYQMLFGEARKLHSFIYLHIGNRVECSVVYDRKVLLGQNGLTGALGDIFVTPETDKKTGELGRLNHFVSLSSLKSKFDGKIKQHEDLLTQLNSDSKHTLSWLKKAEEPLRIAIHTLESIFNSQTIILGGDINDWLLDTLIKQLRPYIPSIAQYGERDIIRIVKTPNVENIAQRGLATLPLYAALSIGNQHILHCPEQLNVTPLQELIYGLTR